MIFFRGEGASLSYDEGTKNTSLSVDSRSVSTLVPELRTIY